MSNNDAITIEPGGSRDSGPCKCCGQLTRAVWGYLYDAGVPAAAYYVTWTLGRIDHGASFDFVIGEWGEQASSKDQSVVAVAFQWTPSGPGFMVMDAEGRLAATAELAKTALRRDQVVGTPLATMVYAMLDAIWLNDDRIRELTDATT